MSVDSARVNPRPRASLDLALLRELLPLAAILVGIYLTSRITYLLFHSLADLFSVLVAFAVFIIAWHSHSVVRNNYLLVLGVGSLFVSMLDLVHVLVYHDMGVLPSFGPALSSQLWIGARMLQAITVLAAPFFLHRSVRPAATMLVYAAASTLLLLSIFVWQNFPVTFVEGSGVTPFKTVSEYVVIAILVAALALLWRKRGEFSPMVFGLLVASIVAMIASEAMFTHYLSLTEASMIVGHLFKIVEFYLLYLAIVRIGLTQPYSLLFRQMKREDEEQIADQRQRAEEQAAELDAIFSAMTTGVVLYAPDGSLLRANSTAQAFLTYTQVPPDLPLEQRVQLHGFLDEEYQPLVDFHDSPVYRALQGETVRNVVLGAPHAVTGDVLWMVVSTVPVRGPTGEITGAVMTFRDITERKLAEEEVQRLNQELEHRILDRTSQLEAANQELEAFAYSVSHDVRPPLRHVSAYLELMQADSAEPPQVRGDQYLELVSQSATEMRQLVDNLMLFSQLGRSRLNATELEIDHLLRHVIQELKAQTEGRQVTWGIAPMPCVTADKTMLRVVFRNLISNALQFTRTRDEALIEVGVIEDSPRELVFYVRDNGVGFDMAQADKLFGALQGLHGVEDFEGTGIGLANVRRIVARHGGRAWAQGKPDEGSTFYFSLPRVA